MVFPRIFKKNTNKIFEALVYLTRLYIVLNAKLIKHPGRDNNVTHA